MTRKISDLESKYSSRHSANNSGTPVESKGGEGASYSQGIGLLNSGNYQAAIWNVTDAEPDYNGYWTTTSEQIVDDAHTYGEGFVPGKGDIAAVIVDPNGGTNQLVCIEVVFTAPIIEMVDFVAYNRGTSGYSPGDAHDEAVDYGIWEEDDFFDCTDVSVNETIGRDSESTDSDQPDDWDESGGEDAGENTPGAQNIPEFPRFFMAVVPAMFMLMAVRNQKKRSSRKRKRSTHDPSGHT